MDKISQKWLKNYELLKEYIVMNQVVDVSYKTRYKDLDLGRWLAREKLLYKKKFLEEEKIKLLEALGVDWYSSEKRKQLVWQEKFLEVKKYYLRNGKMPKGNNKIANWLQYQLDCYYGLGKTLLTKKKIKKLNELGLDLDENYVPKEDLKVQKMTLKWLDNYQIAKNYFLEYGNLRIPTITNEGIRISKWLSEQRVKKIKGKLNPDQIRLLEMINFEWDVKYSKWLENYEVAKDYYFEKGNLNVSYNLIYENVKLGHWLNYQRALKKGFRGYYLEDKKINLLNEIEMNWEGKIAK